MSRRGVSNRVRKAQIKRIGFKVKETKVGSMVTITVRVIMYEMEITTTTKISIGVTMLTKMIVMGLMFLLKIVKVLLVMVEVVWHELRICFIK